MISTPEMLIRLPLIDRSTPEEGGSRLVGANVDGSAELLGGSFAVVLRLRGGFSLKKKGKSASCSARLQGVQVTNEIDRKFAELTPPDPNRVFSKPFSVPFFLCGRQSTISTKNFRLTASSWIH